jgi:dynein heavy chain
MCTYHEVAKVVEPKIAKLREAESELKVATKEKNAAEERMAKVQAKLDEMQAQFDAAMAQKQVRYSSVGMSNWRVPAPER